MRRGLPILLAIASLGATLRADVEPTEFLETHCLECHDAETAKGEIVLEGLTPAFTEASRADLWRQVMEQIAFGEMPPRKKRRPEATDRDEVVQWIEQELTRAGHAPDLQEKLRSPEYGNYVEHERLFDGSVSGVAFTPARLWRRSPHHFDDQIVRGISLGQGRYGRPNGHLSKLKQPFSLEEKAGLADYAALSFADSATLATMLRNSEALVDKLLAGTLYEIDIRENGEIPEDELPQDAKGKPIRPQKPTTLPAFAEILLSESTPTDKQVDDAIRTMAGLVIEREPGAEDLEKFRAFFRRCAGEGGVADGLRTTLIALAISPEAIYRSELGSGAEDEHGRQMLAPADLAYAISYALTDSPPDEPLLEATGAGRLATREDVLREVTRLWDDDETPKPRILRFFHEFFGYTNAPKVFKDAARFEGDYRSVPDRLVKDLDVLVNHIVREDRDVFAELLTTEKYFVMHSGDNELEAQGNRELWEFYHYLKKFDWKAFPYNTPKEHGERARTISRRFFSHPNGNVVKGWMKYLTLCDENGIDPMPLNNGRQYIKLYDLEEKTFDYPPEQPFVLAQGKRIGVLMHPAWLLAHSLNLDNDPVRRGKWIRERLLAGTVPELPITVDARIPEDPESTLRERFSAIREDRYCWRCHERMNPLGMPFESFDDFGRHRDGLEKLLGEGKKTRPVDSTGNLEGTGDPTLDGPVEEPVEMLRRIARSERARQSFVRHAFRYWMGRNELLSDSSTLIDADNAYTENGGSLRALVLSLLTSDSFLYRKHPEPDPR